MNSTQRRKDRRRNQRALQTWDRLQHADWTAYKAEKAAKCALIAHQKEKRVTDEEQIELQRQTLIDAGLSGEQLENAMKPLLAWYYKTHGHEYGEKK